jgi:coproporphyrinogen III oxidase
MPEPQGELLDALLQCLPQSASSDFSGSIDGSRYLINESVKKALANAGRKHYKQYPEAMALQASGNVIPPTVANHR